jgi:hypothetical protein
LVVDDDRIGRKGSGKTEEGRGAEEKGDEGMVQWLASGSIGKNLLC